MKNVLGIIMAFDNAKDLRDLTDHRTVGAIPFGGRYRIIDFMLSNMVNANINNVGIVMRDHYQSLIDHIGNGKDWDLGRKIGGVRLLPPYSYSQKSIIFDVPERRGTIEGLIGVLDFIKKSKCNQIIMSEANIVTNLDLEKVVEFHRQKDAGVTCVCVPGVSRNEHDTFYNVDRNRSVIDVCVGVDIEDKCTHTGLGIYVINKELLVKSILYWASHNYKYFEIEGLTGLVKTEKIRAYVHNNYASKITDVKRYFESNMDLLSRDVRNELFPKDRVVYTRVHDEQPTYYSDKAEVVDSLIADGCTLEGNIENSIIFRDVHVEKGATIKNSIILQGANIGQNANISHIISDKDVTIGADKTMRGHANYPIIIAKDEVI